MMQHEPPSEADVRALLEQGRAVQPVPDVVRARSLARARAAIAAGPTPQPEPMPARSGRVLTIALAASIALLVGAAAAVAALGRPSQSPLPEPSVRPTAAKRTHAPSVALPPAVPVASEAIPERVTIAKHARAGRPVSPRESYAAELDLLQRAQVAYASRDFSGALALVAEHARRFPRARLAEEREALRVRSLAGAGRADEAARAASAFGERFPRSVLLPRLGQDLR